MPSMTRKHTQYLIQPLNRDMSYEREVDEVGGYEGNQEAREDEKDS